MNTLVLATDDGVVIAERAAKEWRVRTRGLPGRETTCVIARADAIIAGTTDGIFRSDDRGATWRNTDTGLTTGYVRWLASDTETILVGTEPAAIFVSRDHGASWRECPEVARLRDQFKWSLPYSPRAGCVRGFAFHDARVYAAVEVGGVLRSDDRGETWRLAGGSDGKPKFGAPRQAFVHPDVHSIAIPSTSTDLVFAPTGGGFYASRDGGATWELLYDCYCRAAWVDANDPAHLILGPARGVDSHGRIDESRDGGATWHTASRGLATPWREHMVERFAQIGDELYAILSNGELIVTSLDGIEWRGVLPDAPGVRAIAPL